ncbi:Glycine receptor subunit alpha-2 [Penaeus vannamei]|uniref:Glycine receptor subunit alpha-2 n=1 Tax=Penaeus vannamei TaxID=6689 RepID=A0A3R7ST48_PENVA|nr:Glycine receptor subunit alpha-2 [Penaeus vannamei]
MNSASLIQPFGGIQLQRDGRIFWGQMFVIKLGCPMFFHDFPFDVQVCKIEMASYFHSVRDMSFAWHGDGISASPSIEKLLGNYEFAFVQENVTSCKTIGYVFGKYPCLRSKMTFKRRYRNYLLGVYVPSSLFVVVSWASFFWPAEAIPARTVLLITALLTTISLYSGVQQMTPAANYTRAIDTWFFACIMAVAMALFQYAIILQIRNRQKLVVSTRVKPMNSSESTDDARDYWLAMERKVELGAKILYVLAFLLFNLVYWSTLKPRQFPHSLTLLPYAYRSHLMNSYIPLHTQVQTQLSVIFPAAYKLCVPAAHNTVSTT